MVMSVILRMDLTTGIPIVIFGTKCPSITSTCSIVAPPDLTVSISSASLVKSADKIEGAISNILWSTCIWCGKWGFGCTITALSFAADQPVSLPAACSRAAFDGSDSVSQLNSHRPSPSWFPDHSNSN